jgi:hypothetical protein
MMASYLTMALDPGAGEQVSFLQVLFLLHRFICTHIPVRSIYFSVTAVALRHRSVFHAPFWHPVDVGISVVESLFYSFVELFGLQTILDKYFLQTHCLMPNLMFVPGVNVKMLFFLI